MAHVIRDFAPTLEMIYKECCFLRNYNQEHNDEQKSDSKKSINVS